MDDLIELAELGAETEAKTIEKKMVEDLQAFIDANNDLFNEPVGNLLDETEDFTTRIERIDAAEIINERIAELDQQCGHYNEEVGVHGTVYTSALDPIREVDTVLPIVMTGQKLESRGFTVQRVVEPDGSRGRALVGHLFDAPQEDVSNLEKGLIQSTRHYYAFAPYGTIDIEAARTPEESLQFLWTYIPEIMQELDDLLLDTHSKIGEIMALRTLSYQKDRIPNNVLHELVHYVNRTIAPEKIGALTATINGVYSIDFADNAQSLVPLNYNELTGGHGLVLASPQYFFLSEYPSFIKGTVYSSKDLYWSVGLDVHRAEPWLAPIEGKTIDVMVGDLRDPILFDLAQGETI